MKETRKQKVRQLHNVFVPARQMATGLNDNTVQEINELQDQIDLKYEEIDKIYDIIIPN